ncbi:MAG: hypothetical protein JWQ48_2386 [Conexibacter sp.]|nr:hypothetical protein [Conexibacter sp.]
MSQEGRDSWAGARNVETVRRRLVEQDRCALCVEIDARADGLLASAVFWSSRWRRSSCPTSIPKT